MATRSLDDRVTALESTVAGLQNLPGELAAFREEVNARFDRHPVDAGRANGSVLAFRFYGFPVPDFGTYQLEVAHGEETLVAVPFWVVPTEDAPPGMAGAGEQPETPSSGYL